MKSTHLKGTIHAALAIGAFVEAMTTESRARRLLNGAAAGWHLHGAVYHFFYEKDDTMPTWKEVVHGYDEEADEEDFWET
jgi:hypothetical protein